MTVITYVYPHGQILYKQGKIVTVCGSINWTLVDGIEVPESFRPANMPLIPVIATITGTDTVEFAEYSDGIIGKGKTNYWYLLPGTSWITN